MANTFIAAMGYPMGGSYFEKEQLEKARELLGVAEKSRCCLQLPVDVTVARELKEQEDFRIVPVGEIGEEWMAVDIGPETASLFSDTVAAAGTVLWNGPLGVFETAPFHRGTETVARAVARSKAFSIVGGGDIVAAIEGFGLADKISFISTGGGATLEFWEGKKLPGIAVLKDR